MNIYLAEGGPLFKKVYNATKKIEVKTWKYI